jgi:glucose/arabinose dehydrogenase
MAPTTTRGRGLVRAGPHAGSPAGLLPALIATLLFAACGPTSPSASSSGRPALTATPLSSTPTLPPATPVALEPYDPTGVRLTTEDVVGGLVAPVDVTSAGDGSGRLFVVEQEGRIRIVKDGVLVGRSFLDIADRVGSGGERGLLGLAFHPDYPADPRFFVDYTDRKGNTVIAAFTVDGSDADLADRDSETVILGVDQPYPNHNGGAVAFGPDRMLYIGMGDGGSGGDPEGYGQRVDTLLGKILRIDVTPSTAAPYAIPAGNPLVGTADARPEIWMTGLRNPWRMRFDRATGDLWIGDVGQGDWEEIDIARAGVGGLNYGWNVMEGFHCFLPSDGCDQDGLTLPVAEYGHDLGCAVIGGVVVRDARQPALDGGYLFGDSCSDNLWLLDPTKDGQQTPVIAGQAGGGLSAIGEGEDGTVYATDLGRGELIRITGSRN